VRYFSGSNSGSDSSRRSWTKTSCTSVIAALLGFVLIAASGLCIGSVVGPVAIAGAQTSVGWAPTTPCGGTPASMYTSTTVPAGVTQIEVQAWGASGAASTGTSGGSGQSGGFGGYASATFPVTPGETISASVACPTPVAHNNYQTLDGGGWANGGSANPGGGNGGAASAVCLTAVCSSASPSTALLVAGGGGGAGGGNCAGQYGWSGGNGGSSGNTGANGGWGPSGANGSATRGQWGTGGHNDDYKPAQNGGSPYGETGNIDHNLPGGGGGYSGGQVGNDWAGNMSCGSQGGGGGGSSWVGPSASSVSFSNWGISSGLVVVEFVQ
jgi:hypothetical protein